MNKLNFLNRQIVSEDGLARYMGVFLEQPDQWFARLRKGIPWRQDVIRMFGREVVTARRVSWHGDPGCDYRYSGVVKAAQPWTDDLLEIKQRVEAACGAVFNSCLLNLYYDGSQGMGWHSDDEPELGHESVIASVSLGAARVFRFRRRTGGDSVNVQLESGSLLVMEGGIQRHWQHCLPKSARCKEPRINLTFRLVLGV
jgi:alkylated DNA repair dioxygenase AlkB